MILFRHSDPRFPFLWESSDQPPGRWNGHGEGPVQYFADTPDGAWAEFLRHEGITDEEDLPGIERDLWSVELPPDEEPDTEPALPVPIMEGGVETYQSCQVEARRLRELGISAFIAPSAALLPGAASGWRVRRGTIESGPPRAGQVVVLFGTRPDMVGWCASHRGRPGPRVLPRIRQLPNTPARKT